MFAPRIPYRANVGSFGRRRPLAHMDALVPAPTLSEDLRLFIVNFLGGLIFMTIYLA